MLQGKPAAPLRQQVFHRQGGRFEGGNKLDLLHPLLLQGLQRLPGSVEPGGQIVGRHPQGAALLRQLVEAAGQEVEILVGAGVSAANIPALAAQTGARAFHLSGKQVLDSRMTFRREGVPMGLPGFSEFEIWQTSEENIRAARTALDAL